jgi:hypothetical protein
MAVLALVPALGMLGWVLDGFPALLVHAMVLSAPVSTHDD